MMNNPKTLSPHLKASTTLYIILQNDEMETGCSLGSVVTLGQASARCP